MVSLVAYILGCLVVAAMLSRDIIDFSEKKEMVKSLLLVIAMSLLWPALGAWMLWEAFDIWMLCNKNQVRDAH